MSKTLRQITWGAIVGLVIVLLSALGPEPEPKEVVTPKEYIESKIESENPGITYDEIVVCDYQTGDDGEPNKLSYRVYFDDDVILQGEVMSGEGGVYF